MRILEYANIQIRTDVKHDLFHQISLQSDRFHQPCLQVHLDQY